LHLLALRARIFNKMMFDVVLRNEVRDGRRVIEALVVASALDARVNKELDIVCDRSVDESLALRFLGLERAFA
jgi:hypothetical protein